jgi:PAS domain S-box-containing protein
MKNQQIKILMVDDQPNNLRFLSSILMEQGYKVQRAISGQLALNAANAAPPDLILLDILMPEMNGYEVCQKLKASEKTRPIPVIFLSAIHEVPDKVKALRMGGVDFITKPFQVEEVLARIENQLAIQKLQRQLQEQNQSLQQEIEIRTQVEQALRESEHRFRQLAENIQDVFWISEPKSRQVLYVSAAYEQIWGRSSESLYADSIGWLKAIHPLDRERMETAYFEKPSAREFDHEYRIVRPDGTIRWVRDRGFPVKNESGEVYRITGIAEDITERKQAELELATAKAALERQVNRAWLLEKITQEIRSSLQPEQVFQTAAIQIGQALKVNRCLIHSYVAQPTPQIPFVAEYTQPGNKKSPPNTEIPVSGNPHLELVLNQDRAVVSDDVYAEPLLKPVISVCQQFGLKSMLAVRTSYQGEPNGVIGVHQCDRFRQWTEDEIELIESVAAQVGIAIAQANLLEQQTRHSQELAIQNHALQKAKLEAETANRAKSHFLSKMSHELRTPLNAILGFSQMMTRNPCVPTEQLEYIEIINRSGEHLLDLINDILSMAKIEAGQAALHESCFDLYYLFTSLEEMFLLKAAAKGLKLKIERTLNVPQYVQTDEGKLRQVLTNLLSNAIKFTTHGSVTLRVMGNKEGGQGGAGGVISSSTPDSRLPTPYSLIFQVEDTGSGIAEHELSTIFDPFVQTQTGRQSMQGTGLGLAITKQFVRLMGGDITVSSQPGKGTTFTFDIQLLLVSSASEKTISSTRRVIGLESNQPTYRILVVEDVRVNRQLLIKMLSPLGFEVREAENGQQGIDLWQSWKPHLIFMDMQMPVMDGYEATKQIKQLSIGDAEVPEVVATNSCKTVVPTRSLMPKGQHPIIIALTASAFEEQQLAILSAGCDDFLIKPFREETLLEKITKHLGARYIYEGENQPTLYPSSALTKPLTTEDLSVMPREWLNKLYTAALVSDDRQVIDLVEQIPQTSASLVKTLTNLVDNFRLDIIVDLTEAYVDEQ